MNVCEAVNAREYVNKYKKFKVDKNEIIIFVLLNVRFTTQMRVVIALISS